jgi:hypothetical protein
LRADKTSVFSDKHDRFSGGCRADGGFGQLIFYCVRLKVWSRFTIVMPRRKRPGASRTSALFMARIVLLA